MILQTGTLTLAHLTDAGFDIHASAEVILLPSVPTPIPTNLRVTLPPNSVGLVKPRSGLAFKFGIDTLAGVIDESYEGEIKVLLVNHGENPYKVLNGNKIAQLVVIPVLHPEVETKPGAIFHSPLEDKTRGTNGFGHTGK